MSNRQADTVVHVVGCAPSGGGYPNAINTVRMLKNSESFSVIDHCFWLPDSVKLWEIVGGARLRLMVVFSRLVALSFVSVMRCFLRLLLNRGRSSWIYLPYPSIIPMLMFSLMPSFLRPRLICDFYISVFDSAYVDRGIDSCQISARTVFLLERYALKYADRVFVDTEGTKNEMVSLFSLDPDRVFSLPLAINESVFDASCGFDGPRKEGVGPVILFIGNLSPLHGIGNVLEAVKIASKDRGFRFYVVGDGQDGSVVKKFLADNPDVPIHWSREWHDEVQLSRLIADADICLGIFGSSEKARRVFPFKNYLYLCTGRPVISQTEFTLPEGISEPPVVTCGREPAQISDQIIGLLDDAAKKERLGLESSRYFRNWLGQGFLVRRWREILGV